MRAHVDLNHATIHEIERAFHSRERANQILNKRELLGDFKSWADLKDKLPGISDDIVRRLREAGVTVGPEDRAPGETHRQKRHAS